MKNSFIFLVVAVLVYGLATTDLNSSMLTIYEEVDISFKELPDPIKHALRDLKIGQVEEIERETDEEGVTTFEVELRVGKHEVELELNPQGVLLGVEIERDDDDD